MRIKSLILYNYKNFYKKNEFDLSPSKYRNHNMVLIGGVNGTGKTTILEAFNVCLYGRKYNGRFTSRNSYNKFLTSIKNRDSIKNGDKNYYVELNIELNDSYQKSILNIKRQWTVDDFNITESFFIKPLEIIPEEYWEDYIISIIPPFISEYFFFDGEKVKELSYGDHAEKILYDAISDLIGLNLYKNLNEDLGNLIKKIKRRNIKNIDTLEEINRKERKVNKNESEIEELKRTIEKNESKIDGLKNDSNKIEENLKRTAGLYAKNGTNYQVELFEISGDLKKIEEEIINICSEILPFIMSSDLSSKLVKQVKKEKKLKELISNKNILKDIKIKLLRKININKKFVNSNKVSFTILKEEVKQTFIDMFNELDKNPTEKLLHDLTNSEINFIEDTIKKSRKNITTDLKRLLKTRENIIFQKNVVTEKLNQIPEDGLVDKNLKKITSIQKNIGLLTEENKNLYLKISILEDEDELLNLEIDKLEKLAVFAEKDNIKVDVSDKIQNVINVFLNQMVKKKIKKLEDETTNMYRRLANKDDMVREIKIDRDNFKTMLIDFESNIVEKDSISEGEKEIYALSILWGLSRLCDKKLPMIIDTPLAKLDSKHRNSIISEFLPNAADQIIILAHDKEIDNNSYLKLKSNINRTYTLTFNKEEKIKEGYLL